VKLIEYALEGMPKEVIFWLWTEINIPFAKILLYILH
jgi:hypothetical protein